MTKDRNFFGLSYDLRDSASTLRHYDAWASTYDREIMEENCYAQPSRVSSVLINLGVSLDSRVFDAGCGSGLSGLALRDAGFVHIDGGDFCSEMLSLADEKGCYASLSRIDLNEPLTISSSTYDIVTAVGVFSFGHISADACDELLRILRPGGHLVIALNEKFWDEGSLASKLDELESRDILTILKKEYGDHLPGHSVNGWVIVVRKHAP